MLNTSKVRMWLEELTNWVGMMPFSAMTARSSPWRAAVRARWVGFRGVEGREEGVEGREEGASGSASGFASGSASGSAFGSVLGSALGSVSWGGTASGFWRVVALVFLDFGVSMVFRMVLYY